MLRVRRRFSVFLAGLLLVLASTAWAVAPAGPDPAIQRWPNWPHRVACRTLAVDPVKTFSRPANAEKGPGAAEAALRRFLRTPAADELPKRHWRLFAKGRSETEFLNGLLDEREPLPLLRFSGGSRRTRPASERCIPQSIWKGDSATPWVLDVREPPPDPAGDTIVIRIRVGCRNPISRREVHYGQKTIRIIFWVRNPQGATCLANFSRRVEVKLTGPVGERQIYDGVTYPPRRVEYGEDPRSVYPSR